MSPPHTPQPTTTHLPEEDTLHFSKHFKVDRLEEGGGGGGGGSFGGSGHHSHTLLQLHFKEWAGHTCKLTTFTMAPSRCVLRQMQVLQGVRLRLLRAGCVCGLTACAPYSTTNGTAHVFDRTAKRKQRERAAIFPQPHAYDYLKDRVKEEGAGERSRGDGGRVCVLFCVVV